MPLGIHRDLAIVAISAFIWGLGEGLFIFFLPLALQMWNSDAVQIGAVLSMIGVTMAVVQVPAGYFSDRFGTRPLIFASLLLGIASAIVMAAARSLPFLSPGYWLMVVLRLLALPSTAMSQVYVVVGLYNARLRSALPHSRWVRLSDRYWAVGSQTQPDYPSSFGTPLDFSLYLRS